MSKRGQQPRLFPHVLQAIISLKEAGGSSSGRIKDLVQSSLNKSSPTPRNLTMQIRRAIRHGVETGLIKHRSGRYSANLKIFDPLNFYVAKRGRKASKTSKRRRKRPITDPFEEHFLSPSDSGESISGTATEASKSRSRSATPEPSEGCKRSNKRKQSRKCKRRRRSLIPTVDGDDDPNAQGYSGHQSKENSSPECGNPDCLCNLKQEPVEGSRKPPENFQGEYIN